MRRLEMLLVATVMSVAPIFVAVGCSSTGTTESKALTISETDGGNGVRVVVSESLARSVLEGIVGAELECGADLDGDFAAMLRELDRGGRGSRATLSDGDGVLTARRSGRNLRMDFDDFDGTGGFEIRMPWAVAECLLDGSGSLKPKDAASIRLRFVGSEGGSFELSVR